MAPFRFLVSAYFPQKSDNAEATVLNFVNEQNRPLNKQIVTDALRKFNLKKTAIKKALDSLEKGGKISFKEYGKQKIYVARQDQFEIPNNEELNQMKEENANLQKQLEEQKKVIGEVEAEIKSLQSNLTMEQICEKEVDLRMQVQELEIKLNKFRGGVTLVRPEERMAVESMLSEKISQWSKRKRMFRDLWDTLTENSPKDPKEFKEELGLEYDEDVGVSLQSCSDLIPQDSGVNNHADGKREDKGFLSKSREIKNDPQSGPNFRRSRSMLAKLNNLSSQEILTNELEAERLITSLLTEKLYSKELQVEQIQAELDTAVRGNYMLRSEVQNMNNTIAIACHEFKNLELQMLKKDGDLQESTKELSIMRGVLQKVSEERDKLWEKVKQISEDNMLLNSEIEVLKEKILTLETDVLFKEGQITILKEERHKTLSLWES